MNTNGGLIGEAYIHGMNNITEAVRQLRGTATNQVQEPDPRARLVRHGRRDPRERVSYAAMRTIKPGLRLKSAVCSTEVMVIRAPAGEAQLGLRRRGDARHRRSRAGAGAAWIRRTLSGSLIGKRYVDAEERFELLCTKGGEGSLSLNGAPLSVKQAKALPSSD